MLLVNPKIWVLGVLLEQTDAVHEARQKIEAGERLDSWRTEERPYFCRGCETRQLDKHVPRGWYILTRSPGGAGKSHRLGLFCSAQCLVNQGARFMGIESRLGETWDTASSPYRG